MKIDTIERQAKNTIAILNNMSEEERLAADGWVSSMMNAKRMLEIVEIFRSLEEDEIKQLKELSKIVVYGDIRSAKPIKEKYNLSWNELKIIIMAF